MSEFGTALVKLIVGFDDPVAQQQRAPLLDEHIVAAPHLVGELIACERVVVRIRLVEDVTEFFVDVLPISNSRRSPSWSHPIAMIPFSRNSSQYRAPAPAANAHTRAFPNFS